MVVRKSSGFSLIELMVVIAIITILSTIGFAVFSSAQSKGRDAKRRLELDAIAKALETNKTDTGYSTPLSTQFQGGAFPTGPAGSPGTDPSNNPYCISVTATTNPSAWTAVCPAGNGWMSINVSPAGVGTSWRLCTSGETIGVVCKTNAQ